MVILLKNEENKKIIKDKNFADRYEFYFKDTNDKSFENNLEERFKDIKFGFSKSEFNRTVNKDLRRLGRILYKCNVNVLFNDVPISMNGYHRYFYFDLKDVPDKDKVKVEKILSNTKELLEVDIFKIPKIPTIKENKEIILHLEQFKKIASFLDFSYQTIKLNEFDIHSDKVFDSFSFYNAERFASFLESFKKFLEYNLGRNFTNKKINIKAKISDIKISF